MIEKTKTDPNLSSAQVTRAKPDWLKVRAPGGESFRNIKGLLREKKLFTVCEEARCPNIGECWAGGTATFMILGGVCTRGCKFCAVKTGNPRQWVDHDEPEKTARSVEALNLKYIVLTSVDRDDLTDQGASHFAQTVALTKKYSPKILVEVLTPDWRGADSCIETMVRSEADVLAHNLETVDRLQLRVRDPRASYVQSLAVLRKYREGRQVLGRPVVTKSSLMLGLGERPEEVRQAMRDLLAVGVRVLTLGQYLQPTKRHLPVQEYIRPEVFQSWAREGEEMGFAYVAAGPLVRSSYRAGEYFIEKILKENRL